MNLLDLLAVVLAVSAGVGGYRLGLLARVTSWVGMALGLVLSARFLPTVIRWVANSDPTSRLLVAAGVLVGGAFLGQALGLLAGSQLHLALPVGRARLADRGAGAVTGVLGVAVALWLLVPAMADVAGWPARLARTSTVAQALHDVLPRPPDTLHALRRLVGDSGFPQVFSGLQAAPDVGPPPAATGIAQSVADRVVASTVLVEGTACRRIQEGSGFVAGPGVVVTNAHVVAGQERTEVMFPDGRRRRGVVTVFDADRDLAVLHVDVAAAPLPIADGEVGEDGGVFGHPGGGPLRIAPFSIRREVEAVGRDLYDRHQTRREVFILASDLAPGDSGAALVNPDGEVVGVAFAIAPDRPGTSYALTTDELEEALAADDGRPDDTGPCIR